MEIKHCKKLFYKEYAYKIRLQMPTGYNQYIKVLLRYSRDKTVENKLESLMKSIQDQRSDNSIVFEGTQDQLKAMYDWVFWGRANDILTKGRVNEYWKLVTYYTNDTKLVTDCMKKFEILIDHIEQPANLEEHEMLKEKRNTTIVDRLPYNKYRYACNLGYWDLRDDSICEKFIRWSEPYGKRIKISALWGERYGGKGRGFNKFWVEDKKLLNMVQLFMGKAIRHIESYALRSELLSSRQKDMFNEN
jgi:hypothetical protein